MKTMPFGMYHGIDLPSIPKSYLRWLLRNCEIKGDLLDSIRAVLNGQSPPPSQADLDADMIRRVDEIVGQ